MRFLIDDLLWRALVHVGVRLELEQQVEHVDDEQDHTGATADLEYGAVRGGLAVCTK